MTYPINPFPMPSTGWTFTTSGGSDPYVLERLEALEKKVDALSDDGDEDLEEIGLRRFLFQKHTQCNNHVDVTTYGEGVVFSDGSVVMHWLQSHSAITIYPSLDELRQLERDDQVGRMRGVIHFIDGDDEA